MSVHILQSLITVAAEEAHEVDLTLVWGIGALTLAILVGLLFALVSFGAGRDHS